MKTFTLALLLTAISFSGFAQTNYFIGGTGDGMGFAEWLAPENWSLNEVPTENHDVVFDSAHVSISEVRFRSVTSTVRSFLIKRPVEFAIGGSLSIKGTGLVLDIQKNSALGLGGGYIKFLTPGATAKIDGSLSFILNSGAAIYNNTNCITRVSGSVRETDPYSFSTMQRTIISSPDSFYFDAGSRYSRNFNGPLPLATWHPTSKTEVHDLGNRLPENLNQTFGNLNISFTEQNDLVEFYSDLNVAGNLFLSLGGYSGSFIFSKAATERQFNVGGNLYSDATIVLVAGAGDVTMTVGGNVSMPNDGLMYQRLILKNGAGKAKLTVNGDFEGALTLANKSGDTTIAEVAGNFFGTTDQEIIFSSVTDGIGILRVGGDISLDYNANLTETGSGNSQGLVELVGGAVHHYKPYQSKINENVSLIVKAGSTLQMDTSDARLYSGGKGLMEGSGKLILESGATLGIKHVDGISSSGLLGCIRLTGTRTYSPGAHYIFNGKYFQQTGNGINEAASITVDNSGGYALKLTNDSAKLGGNLYLKNGGLNAANKKLFIEGDWINDAGTNTDSLPDIIFTGDTTSRIAGSQQTEFNNLKLNKSNALTVLSTDSRIRNAITLGSNLKLENQYLTLGDTATIEGSFDATKMIIADGSGELRRTFTTISSVEEYLFPVGNSNGTAAYTPAKIIFSKASATTGTIGIRLKNQKHPQNNFSGSHLNRYWTVTNDGLTDFEVKAGFNYADEDVIGTESEIELGKWNGNAPWVIYEGSITPAGNYLLSETITSFSDFTGLSEAVIPPFAFGNVNAIAGFSNTVEIDFAVSNENDIVLYEVERSSGSGAYVKIGEVDPTNAAGYDFTDSVPLIGNNVYRIKAIKANSEFVYSETASIEIEGANSGRVLNVYPNPIQANRLILTLKDIKPGKYSVIITNSNGNSIYSTKLEATSTTVQQEIILNGSLPRGIYRVRITNDAATYVQTFMK